MISQQIESFVRLIRKGDAETLSLTEMGALRSHLEEFIEESDLLELSGLLSCYPTRSGIRSCLEAMIGEAEESIRRLYASGRCQDKGEDSLLF